MSNSLWERFQQFYTVDDELGVSLDVSRMRFDEAWLADALSSDRLAAGSPRT